MSTTIDIFYRDAPPAFKEAEHPRAKSGEFAKKGEGSASAKPQKVAKSGLHEFTKQTPPEGDLHGVAFKSWTPPKDNDGWEKLADESKFDEPALPSLPKGKRQGAAVIVKEPDGRVWIVKPTENFGEFNTTFPGGGVEKGMSPKGTALKEAYEESGLKLQLTGVAGDVERSTRNIRYYNAKRTGGTPADHGWESEAVLLAHPSDLPDQFHNHTDQQIAHAFLGAPKPKEQASEGKASGTDPSELKELVKSPAKLDALSESSHKLGKSLDDLSDVSSAAKGVINQWTSPDGYKRINNHLSGASTNPKAAKEAETLQAAVMAHKLPHDVHAYRGIHGPQSEAIRSRKEGDTFEYPGFLSTTIDPKRATHFARGGKGDLIHMQLPKGAPALYVSHPNVNSWESERELLLPHGSKFRYIGNEDVEIPEYNYSGQQTGGLTKVKLHHIEPILDQSATAPDKPSAVAPKASKPELPEPSPQSKPQQAMHKIATSSLSPKDKRAKLQDFETYSGGFAEKYKAGLLKALANDRLTIDINFLDDFDPADHPQAPAGSSKGGQFIAKGEAAALTEGFEAPDITSKSAAKYFTKPVAELKKAAKSGASPEEIAEKIKAIAGGHAHSTVATYANKIIQALEQHVGHTPGILGKATAKGGQAAKPEAPAAPSPPKAAEPEAKPAKAGNIVTKEDAEKYAPDVIAHPEDYTTEYASKVYEALPITSPHVAAMYGVISAKTAGAKKPEEKLPSPKDESQKKIYNTVAHPNASAEAKADAIVKFALQGPQAVKSYANLALKALGQPKMFEHPGGEEKKPEPEKAPEPELPKPNEQSEIQKNLYSIASSSKPKDEKVAALQAQPVPTGGYSIKYKTELLKALGAGPSPTPSKPASTVIAPSNPPPSWKAGMAVLENATRNESSSWDQEKARTVMPTAKQGYWNKHPEQRAACKTYIGSSGGINGALRHPQSASQHYIDAIHAIDAAFLEDAALTTQDMVVHRGLPLVTANGKQTIPLEDIKERLAKGLPSSFQWDGFVSTSFASAAAFSGNDVQVEIGVKKGSPALAWGGSIGLGKENEVLLEHGRSFQVLSLEEIPSPGKTRYRVKVVMK